MKFWDSSAIVPLCLRQPLSATSRALHDADGDLVVWWATSLECASAIARLHRDGLLTARDERAARDLLASLKDSWYEVQPSDDLREQAMRLLRLHPLRAADALQLAAALVWAGSPPVGEFITFDERLKEAAQREGLATA